MCADQFNLKLRFRALNICCEFASGLLNGRVLSKMVCSESFAQPSALTGQGLLLSIRQDNTGLQQDASCFGAV